jgi:RimJ/RimL family protein N-acetyltransferase
MASRPPAGAVAALLDWAQADPRVTHVEAETGADNLPSQRVLERCGFARIGTRIDPQDGALVCWQAAVPCR